MKKEEPSAFGCRHPEKLGRYNYISARNTPTYLGLTLGGDDEGRCDDYIGYGQRANLVQSNTRIDEPNYCLPEIQCRDPDTLRIRPDVEYIQYSRQR